jgi:hypothetical protein
MQSGGGRPLPQPYLPANALADRAKLLRHISSLSEDNTRLQLQLNGGPAGSSGGGVGSASSPSEIEAQLVAKNTEVERLVQQLAEGDLLQESLRKRIAELEEDPPVQRQGRRRDCPIIDGGATVLSWREDRSCTDGAGSPTTSLSSCCCWWRNYWQRR